MTALNHPFPHHPALAFYERAPRAGRIEHLAITASRVLLEWALRRSSRALDREEHTRRRRIDIDRREREYAALRLQRPL